MEIRKGRINYRGQRYAALILLEYVWDKIKLLDLTCDYLFWEVVLGYSITGWWLGGGSFMKMFSPCKIGEDSHFDSGVDTTN